MKKLLLGLILSAAHPAFSQSSFETAQVTQMQGKYIFYFMQPAAPYTEAFSFSTPPMPACGTVTERARAVLNAALMEAGAQQKPFDAIVIGDGSRDIAIKFKEGTAPAQAAQCAPLIMGGSKVYVLAEPSTPYTPDQTLKITWWDGVLTGQCFTIKQVAEKMIKKAGNPEVLIIQDQRAYSVRSRGK